MTEREYKKEYNKILLRQIRRGFLIGPLFIIPKLNDRVTEWAIRKGMSELKLLQRLYNLQNPDFPQKN